ncbi:FtsK/SpoIIIE domain-containing protein [Agromyces mediolanus]|uniref:FtsK/SpoIIIE domain-containing protein n=1 Tax=Agromyces mediolanus TaxID=41986 RepID=UPI0038378301
MDAQIDRLPRLRLPSPPGTRAKAPFPILATLAPIATAGVLFALTRSPLALVFAAVGPLVGIAAMLDGRRGARRAQRGEARDRARAQQALDTELTDRHAVERAEAWRRTPPLELLLTEPPGARWFGDDGQELVLGRGTAASLVQLEGEAVDEADHALLARAASLPDAPVRADLAAGIGFVGPELLARAAARATVVRWASTVRPGGRAGIAVPTTEAWAWAAQLPHRGADASLTVVDGALPAGAAGVIAVAADRGALPPGLGTVVRLRTARQASVERLGVRPWNGEFAPDLLGERQAEAAALRLARTAARSGLDETSLPRRVDLAGLTHPRAVGRGSLAVTVGAGRSGPLELDLVRQGPHALIGGTTGSGKSEFLLTWLAALAVAYSPARVAMLLVDFKGGAAFQPIADLPHVVGIVTDLDEAEALRAVESLRAEIRRREQQLRADGARDFVELDDGTELPRLVIVVDEYQALVERFEPLARLFADIAARGRSLGMHLILSTQRPNGTVREQITANCRLRICLRVLHPADSRAVVGVDEAAGIPPGVPGRAVVDDGTGPPRPFQSAIADPLQLELLRAGRAADTPARRPWLDPLPTRLPIAELESDRDGDGGGIGFGLLDAPEQQRRLAAEWRPAADGALLVCGAPGSGRTTTLRTLSAAFRARFPTASVIELPDERAAAWDTLIALAREAESGGFETGHRLLVIDRIDVRFRGWPEEYRVAAGDALSTILRLSGGGLHVAASAMRAVGMPAEVRDGFQSFVLLRQASRGELAQLGGEPALWHADDAPGAGQWRGLRLQVAMPDPASDASPIAGVPVRAGGAAAVASPALPRVEELELRAGRSYALVARNVPLALARLAALPRVRVEVLTIAGQASEALPHAGGDEATVFVGDVDAWAAAWRQWGALKHTAEVLVDGGLPEFRALHRVHELPPLLSRGAPQGWRIAPDGTVARFVWQLS